MDDSTLGVDPEKLRQAATALQNHQGDLLYELNRIHLAHTDLQNSWRGSAADLVATTWQSLNSRVTAHAGRLDGYAQDLRTAAQAFTDQDDTGAAGYGPYTLNL
ncbi:MULTISPECIES: WXG100 family type VII secretion target [unclassified Nocardia]|uniref:WXG100 family type VII secretion target n=1 Tax=unclassified Nocardia TaxID=2637762 RepID=UPI0033A4F98D